MLRFVKQNMKIIEEHKDAFDKYLTIKSFSYYVVVPTYCYQLEYPKSKGMRVGFFIQKSLQLLAISLMTLFLFLQYTYPLLTQSKMYFKRPLNFFEIYPYVV